MQGDDLTERFFRNLTELAVIHCLNSERPAPAPAVGQPAGAQPQPQLNFVATDALVRLAVCLVTGAMQGIAAMQPNSCALPASQQFQGIAWDLLALLLQCCLGTHNSAVHCDFFHYGAIY